MAFFNENIALPQKLHYHVDNAGEIALINCYFYKPQPILVAFFQLLFFMAQFGFY
ncbi:hypothetical protein [Emticicia fontis]